MMASKFESPPFSPQSFLSDLSVSQCSNVPQEMEENSWWQDRVPKYSKGADQ